MEANPSFRRADDRFSLARRPNVNQILVENVSGRQTDWCFNASKRGRKYRRDDVESACLSPAEPAELFIFFCLFVSAAKKTSHMLCVMMKKPPRNNSKIMKLYRNELFLYIPLQQAVDSWRARVYSSCRFDSERDWKVVRRRDIQSDGWQIFCSGNKKKK